MNRLNLFTKTLLALLVLVSYAGCDSGSNDEEERFDFSPILQNVAVNVITATYADLNTAAGTLQSAVAAFEASKSESDLAAAKTAWVNTRAPWEASEGFLFGPVDSKGLDPALDSWPVNEVDLNAVLAGTNTLTVTFVQGLANEQKGFHTIEFLLYGEDGQKAAANFTDRELAYLQAATEALKIAAQELVDSWNSNGDNFANNLVNAGSNGSIYVSAKAAMQELVTSVIGIADEVGNGKIETPFADQNAFEVESRFSRNSITDFQNNVRSIKNVYTGDYANSNGAGLTDFIAQQDAALDQRFKQELDAAIAAIGAIPGSFRDAIFNNASAVTTAQTAVRKVQQTLEEDINPIVSNY